MRLLDLFKSKKNIRSKNAWRIAAAEAELARQEAKLASLKQEVFETYEPIATHALILKMAHQSARVNQLSAYVIFLKNRNQNSDLTPIAQRRLGFRDEDFTNATT